MYGDKCLSLSPMSSIMKIDLLNYNNLNLNMGILITFEGIDRAGKTTQIDKLVEALRSKGHSVAFLAFPTSNATGKFIRQVLSGKESLSPEALHLMFSADRYQAKTKLLEMIAQNSVVILDRYYYSGLAYSLARGLDYGWCLNVDSNLPVPTCVIYLDLDPRIAAKRSNYGDDFEDNIEFQTKVRTMYLTMANDCKWKKINVNMRTINEVHSIVLVAIEFVIMKYAEFNAKSLL